MLTQGNYIEASKITVAEFVRERVTQWEANGDISARTAERYRYLVENQIAPHIGTKVVQKLRPLDIEEWHTTLRTRGHADGKRGIEARTIGHAHRVLSKALSDAQTNELVSKNVCTIKPPPKVGEYDMVIVQDVSSFIAKLALSERLRMPGMVALFTGMSYPKSLRCVGSALTSTRQLFRFAKHWSLPRPTAFGLRRRNPKLVAAISRCPTSWLMRSENIGSPN